MAGGEGKSLEQTPTYAMAVTVFAFVTVSLLLERGLHHLGKWLKKHNQKPLYNALEVIKEELMLLGFISLLLTVFQDLTSQVCVPVVEDNPMLPCPYVSTSAKTLESSSSESSSYYPPPATAEAGHRRLLGGSNWNQLGSSSSRPSPYSALRRILASSTESTCPEGKEPFVSQDGHHQLHILIFLLAAIHVAYSCITMLLAIYKVHRWKAWETEAHELMDKCIEMSTEERIGLMKSKQPSSFVERHTRVIQPAPVRRTLLGLFGVKAKQWQWESTFFLYLTCFFRQFWASVTRADYLTLRLGFITNHNAGLKFDFHSYLIRSMESDFSHVIGTSPSLWAWVVIILLLNVDGWRIFFWTSFIPVILVLLVGTKLEHIMATLAYENADKPALCVGANIKARDDLFWFGRPRILVYIIHFILFQTSFEQAIYFWYLWEFGRDSCFMDGLHSVYIHIGLSLLVQVLCSYITLPLYCLVTQMGSHFRQTIFTEHVDAKIKAWAHRHKKAPSGLAEPIVDAMIESHKVVKETFTEQTKKFKDVVKSAMGAEASGNGSSKGPGAPPAKGATEASAMSRVEVAGGGVVSTDACGIFANRDRNGHHRNAERIEEERDVELMRQAGKEDSDEDEDSNMDGVRIDSN